MALNSSGLLTFRLSATVTEPSSADLNPDLIDEAASPSEPREAMPASMAEYEQLKLWLFSATLILSGLIFVAVWLAYTPSIALNYLLGACVGVVYLRMLSRDVDRLGVQKSRLGATRLALFVGLMVIATQRQQLQVLPIFLGFLTYKGAILLYLLSTLTQGFRRA